MIGVRLVDDLQVDDRVTDLCRVAGVCRSGFYTWRSREHSARAVAIAALITSTTLRWKRFWATLKKEIRHTWGPIEKTTRSELRTNLFDYIEVFYNCSRHQRALSD